MARPRSPDFEDRQRMILRSAAELFSARGYNETLLEDIAEHCGIKRSSVYHYHASKHALLHSLITWKIEDLTEKVEQAVASAHTPREGLQALVMTLVNDYVESPHEVTILHTQTRHLSPTALRATAVLQKRIIEHARTLLQALRPDVQMPRKKNTALAMMLFGMVNWVHVWYKTPGSLSPQDLADLIVRVFLDGMLHQPVELLG